MLILALAIITSLITPAPTHTDIIATGRITTITPARQPKFTKEHVAQAPMLRIAAIHTNGKTTRTLAGDTSGHTVTYITE